MVTLPSSDSRRLIVSTNQRPVFPITDQSEARSLVSEELSRSLSTDWGLCNALCQIVTPSIGQHHPDCPPIVTGHIHHICITESCILASGIDSLHPSSRCGCDCVTLSPWSDHGQASHRIVRMIVMMFAVFVTNPGSSSAIPDVTMSRHLVT